MHSTHRPAIFSGMLMLALVAGTTWSAWKHLVRPLEAREAGVAREFAELGDQIERAQRSIREARELEQQSRPAVRELAALHDRNPAGSPVVWFPARVREHLDRFKIRNATIRLTATRAEPKLGGYERSYWATEIPVERTTSDIRRVLIAMLEIEASDRFVRVMDIAIGPDPGDASRYVALTDLALLAPKQASR